VPGVNVRGAAAEPDQDGGLCWLASGCRSGPGREGQPMGQVKTEEAEAPGHEEGASVHWPVLLARNSHPSPLSLTSHSIRQKLPATSTRPVRQSYSELVENSCPLRREGLAGSGREEEKQRDPHPEQPEDASKGEDHVADDTTAGSLECCGPAGTRDFRGG